MCGFGQLVKIIFLQVLNLALGVVSSTGFETTSESMFLGKKLLTIPIRNQYEQLSNAAALEELGGYIVYNINSSFSDIVNDWLENGLVVKIDEISNENELVNKIVEAGKQEILVA